jgi:hypothetical protein
VADVTPPTVPEAGPQPVERLCEACDGQGALMDMESECCGNYLDSGECCAAIYGTANLIPVQVPIPCGLCGAKGTVDD